MSRRADPDLMRRLAALAERQDGVVSRAQLTALGFSATAIARLIDRPVLRRVHPRVYAYGHSALTVDGRRRAAWLCCGDGSALAGVTALSVHRLIRGSGGLPHLIVPQRRGLKVPALVAHRWSVHPDEIRWWNGMRVTTPEKALVDAAEQLNDTQLTEAFEQAMMRGIYDRRRLEASRARAYGRAGLKRLDRVLAKLGDEPAGYDSRAERRAAELLGAAGHPPDAVAYWIEVAPGRWRRADLWYADIRLDLEIDGPWHLLAHRKADDDVRDAELLALGIETERQPDTLVYDQPAVFVAAVVARLDAMRTRGLAA